MNSKTRDNFKKIIFGLKKNFAKNKKSYLIIVSTIVLVLILVIVVQLLSPRKKNNFKDFQNLTPAERQSKIEAMESGGVRPIGRGTRPEGSGMKNN
jgi:Ni,Fe-hydrogenase III component G